MRKDKFIVLLFAGIILTGILISGVYAEKDDGFFSLNWFFNWLGDFSLYSGGELYGGECSGPNGPSNKCPDKSPFCYEGRCGKCFLNQYHCGECGKCDLESLTCITNFAMNEEDCNAGGKPGVCTDGECIECIRKGTDYVIQNRINQICGKEPDYKELCKYEKEDYYTIKPSSFYKEEWSGANVFEGLPSLKNKPRSFIDVNVRSNKFKACEIAHRLNYFYCEYSIKTFGGLLPVNPKNIEVSIILNEEIKRDEGRVCFENNKKTMVCHGSFNSIRDSVTGHEFTHIFNRMVIGDNIPRAFDEGLAISVEPCYIKGRRIFRKKDFRDIFYELTNRKRGRYDKYEYEFPSKDELILIIESKQYLKAPKRAFMQYSLGWVFIEFLIDKVEREEGITRHDSRARIYYMLNDKIKSGKSLEDVLKLHYGFKNIYDFKLEFETWIKEKGVPIVEG